LGLSIEDSPDEDDRGNSFNDSKHEARKLFIGAYKQSDFAFPDGPDVDIDWSLLYRNALSRSYNYINLGGGGGLDKAIPWWYRRRIKQNKPTDKFGEECENAFGKLFNIKF
jgi:hypothetical protein